MNYNLFSYYCKKNKSSHQIAATALIYALNN
jgi:hypothetical protein